MSYKHIRPTNAIFSYNNIHSLVKKPFILLHRVYGIDLNLFCVVETRQDSIK